MLVAEVEWLQSVIADIQSHKLTWSMEELREKAEQIDNRME
ncbi:hypothetical protein [Paenibacillus sp. 32O-W]|nr:hypothetical protein [Paenibacillus sp. 32O-W]